MTEWEILIYLCKGELSKQEEPPIRELLLNGDDGQIVDYEGLGHDARLSVPTPDHYLPLLYLLGLRRIHDPISFPVQGVDGGSISMLAVQIG